MALNPAKPLRKRFRVAVLASGADFRASADGIPCGVSPLDLGVEGHVFRFVACQICRKYT